MLVRTLGLTMKIEEEAIPGYLNNIRLVAYKLGQQSEVVI